MAPNTTGASARHQNNDRAWRDGVQSINDEAAGMLDVDIIDAAYGATLLVRALRGDRESAALLLAVTQAAALIKRAPRRNPVLCICCPRSVKRLSDATVFGVATPSIANPTGALGFIFCDRCGADRATLAAKAADGLKRIWPDLRPVVVTHPEGGRA
jgi:hypothetical protein